jgi:hypothetical protein
MLIVCKIALPFRAFLSCNLGRMLKNGNRHRLAFVQVAVMIIGKFSGRINYG